MCCLCENCSIKNNKNKNNIESLQTSAGHFGSGVASYFLFLRWLFFLNLWMFLLVTVFVVLPRMIFRPEDNPDTDDISWINHANPTNDSNMTQMANVGECTSRYQVDVRYDDVGQLVLDFLQGTV